MRVILLWEKMLEPKLEKFCGAKYKQLYMYVIRLFGCCARNALKSRLSTLQVWDPRFEYGS